MFTNATSNYPVLWRQISTTTMNATWNNGTTGSTLTATSPATIAATNSYSISGTYQAA
jgi:hypothetical protein